MLSCTETSRTGTLVPPVKAEEGSGVGVALGEGGPMGGAPGEELTSWHSAAISRDTAPKQRRLTPTLPSPLSVSCQNTPLARP